MTLNHDLNEISIIVNTSDGKITDLLTVENEPFLPARRLSFSPNTSFLYNDAVYSRKATAKESFTCGVSSACQTTYDNSRIVINVGGVRFETYKSTLDLISESRLANLTLTNSDYDPARKEYFFDRDPASFHAILNYFRTGKLHAPNTVCGNLFYDELNYWGIDERSIQACCWTTYSAKRECDAILKKFVDKFESEGKV
jgi:hypothetical protein